MKTSLRRNTQTLISPQELQAVHQILITWGAFSLLELGGSLNFLPKNTLEIVSTLGLKIKTGNQTLQWPVLTAHADLLINQLSKFKPKWAEIIKWHYAQTGTIRDKAKQNGLYKSTYYERLVKGQLWIAQQFKTTLH